MKKTILIIVLATLCLIFKVNAQSQHPLNVGDKLPESLWKTVHAALEPNGQQRVIKLDDYREKLIIIDFWATWCSSCIAGFPNLEKLQKEFPDQLKTVLVTDETKEKVQNFLRLNRDKASKPSLSTIIGDTLLNKAFVHQLIPHYVWVSTEGTVLATTSALEINSEHIRAILQKKATKLEPKIDLNTTNPLYTTDYLPSQKLEQYSILLKGYIEGTGSTTIPRTRNNKTIGYLITNASILNMYEHCFNNLDKAYSPIQLRIDVADSSLLIPGKSKLDAWEWYKQHGYSLDFIVPEAEADGLGHQIIEYLNKYSPYEAIITNSMRECLIIVNKGIVEGPAESSLEQIDRFSGGKLKLVKKPISALKARLNNDLYLGYPVLDETGYKGKINIEFDHPVTSLAALKKALTRYGLDLKMAKRRVPHYTIKDKKLTNDINHN